MAESTDLVYGAIMFIAIVIGGSSFYTSAVSQYAVDIPSLYDQPAYVGKADTIIALSDELADAIRTINSGDASLEDKWYAFGIAGQNVVKLLFNIVNLLTDFISGDGGLIDTLRLPSWVQGLAIAVIVFIVVFSNTKSSQKVTV